MPYSGWSTTAPSSLWSGRPDHTEISGWLAAAYVIAVGRGKHLRMGRLVGGLANGLDQSGGELSGNVAATSAGADRRGEDSEVRRCI